MSADDGIYILKTPKGTSHEYRVAHLQAIENLTYEDEDGDILEMWRMFHHSPVFTSNTDAFSLAETLRDIQLPPEYGISKITLQKEFPCKKPPCPCHEISEVRNNTSCCLRCGEKGIPDSVQAGIKALIDDFFTAIKALDWKTVFRLLHKDEQERVIKGPRYTSSGEEAFCTIMKRTVGEFPVISLHWSLIGMIPDKNEWIILTEVTQNDEDTWISTDRVRREGANFRISKSHLRTLG